MPIKHLVPAVLAMACLLAACAEKADEPPTLPPYAADDASPADLLVPGVPEEAHLKPVDTTPEALAAKQTSGTCRIENVVKVVDESPASTDSPTLYRVGRGHAFRMVGFVVDRDAGTVPARVDMVLSGPQAYSVPVRTGGPRSDVAEYFDTPAFADAGFMEDIAFAKVEPGTYAVYFVDPASGATCVTSQSFTVE